MHEQTGEKGSLLKGTDVGYIIIFRYFEVVQIVCNCSNSCSIDADGLLIVRGDCFCLYLNTNLR